METVLERQTITTPSADVLAKEQHNAMINERYRKLLSAEEDQFSTQTPVFSAQTTYAAPVAETPVTQQTPQVTEYVRSDVAASLFSAEKFERLEGFATENAYTDTFAPTVVNAPAPVTQVRGTVKAVESYGLTPFAKIAMAVFTLIVVALLTLIAVNSHTIQLKNIRLQNLEEKKQELLEKNEEIQRRIQEAKSEERVLEYAQSQGMLGN